MPAQKQGKKGKKQREHKVSKGIHGGGGRIPGGLDEVTKVNMGKGLLTGVARRWRPAPSAFPKAES